jgi:hypothetical protein
VNAAEIQKLKNREEIRGGQVFVNSGTTMPASGLSLAHIAAQDHANYLCSQKK